MVGGWLDEIILEVFFNLNDSMILFVVQSNSKKVFVVCKDSTQEVDLHTLLWLKENLSDRERKSYKQRLCPQA